MSFEPNSHESISKCVPTTGRLRNAERENQPSFLKNTRAFIKNSHDGFFLPRGNKT